MKIITWVSFVLMCSFPMLVAAYSDSTLESKYDYFSTESVKNQVNTKRDRAPASPREILKPPTRTPHYKIGPVYNLDIPFSY